MTAEEAQRLEEELISEENAISDGYNISDGGGLGGSPWVTITYDGVTYTPEELAENSAVDGLTSHDITTRIRHHGWSVEKAITKPKMKKNQTFFFNGKYYTAEELKSLSPIPNITSSIIRNRINKHGWDVERAITQPTNEKKQPHGCGTCLFEYMGKIYNSYELCQMSSIEGLTPLDITTRINKHGWSVERAITQPKKKRGQRFSYKGKMYTTTELADLSDVEGMTCHHIMDRIRSGWPVEKAVETPINRD